MALRVLITGITGSIGRHLARVLRDNGYQVSGISRGPRSAALSHDIDHHQLDLCDLAAVDALLETHPVDAVIHLAALVHVRSQEFSFDDYARVNFRSSEALFRSALAHGSTRILFASTVEVYGRQPDGVVVTEDCPCKPDSDYARTKLLAEQSLAQIACGAGLPHAALRFAPVYASDFRLNVDKRLYLRPPNVAYRLGRGDYRLCLCSLRNVETFIVRWLSSSIPPSGAFNLADPESLTARQLLELERAHGRARIVVPLPVTPCVAALAVRETALGVRGIDAGTYSTANLRKLARSTVYSCHRAEQTLGPLPGRIERDLYPS